jgi:two-component system, OmpR family, sensor histidine kinase KdpD
MSRGRLRVYLGAAPGVGKTYAMLHEGRRRAGRGADVVIGVVETHERAQTIAQLGELEQVPRRTVEHRGTTLSDLDVDAVLARAPAVVLVDELAHTNAPGSAREKRWADIDVLLDAGIDVISTVNVQHLESVNDVVERITGIRQQETVPDAWVRRAEQIELVDMTPEALRRRMAHGNVYPSDRIDAALSNYFRPGNLAALRELALLWLADRVEDQLQGYLATHGIAEQWETRERVIVALTGAPGNDQIIRRAARIAGRLRGELVGVHVTAADGRSEPGTVLAAHRRLLAELGGSFRETVGDDVAQALVAVARTERATQLVVGSSRRSRFQELTGGSVVNRLLRLSRDLDVHVISTAAEGAAALPALHRRSTPLPRRRRAAAWVVLAVGLPLIALALLQYRDDLGLTTMLLITLGFVVGVSALGGLAPGLVAAVAGAGLVNYHVVPPTGTLTVASAENAFALVLFIAVGATVATLVDRVARRSHDALRARAEAAALARAAATQAGEADPLPNLVEQVRVTFGLDSIAVLRRNGEDWIVQATAGSSPPTRPEDGSARALGGDAATVVVFGGGYPVDRAPEVVDAFVDQLTVALDRRELQQEAATAAAMAQADALRTGILQAVSHDLRTPLSGIKASVTSLLAPDVHFDPDDTGELLHTIDDEADRLDRVVGNLLDMGRLQTGSLTVLTRPTALEEVVSAALSNLAVAAAAVAVDVPETLPLLQLDGALLERALANVVANALSVQPPGVPVRIEAAAVGAAGREVHLRVVDVGPGIAPERRAEAFEPFQRLGDRSSQAGVGLGLAIAHGFTAALGGVLELDDTPGGGLTATFRLPADRVDPAGAVPEERS